MTLSQIRREIEALKRQYATELAAYRPRPLALEFCDELTNAVTRPNGDPAPQNENDIGNKFQSPFK